MSETHEQYRRRIIDRMLFHPETWPQLTLPMKMVATTPWLFGHVTDSVRPGNIVIYSSDTDEVLATFSTVDELVAAGWSID